MTKQQKFLMLVQTYAITKGLRDSSPTEKPMLIVSLATKIDPETLPESLEEAAIALVDAEWTPGGMRPSWAVYSQ